jgi:hypothetical protein
MLQNFGTGVAHVGQKAFLELSNLYAAHAVKPTGKKSVQLVWQLAPASFVEDYPYACTYLALPPVAGTAIDWKGLGYYTQKEQIVSAPAKALPPLPKAAKWQVALEMWDRLASTHSSN